MMCWKWPINVLSKQPWLLFEEWHLADVADLMSSQQQVIKYLNWALLTIICPAYQTIRSEKSDEESFNANLWIGWMV